MRCTAILLILFAASVCGADFSGSAALEFTRKVVAFGPRPPASQANKKLQAYIKSELRGAQVTDDSFSARTPVGPMTMNNIIAKYPGTSGRAIVITGHFDTKLFPGRRFVGANDGGSSTGFLLELARVVATMPHKDDIYLVFFDGEEAIGEWSSTDGVYGSRHLADKWAADGVLPRIRALINVDMIGDKDLGIIEDFNSSASLRRLVWGVANDLGYGKYFLDKGTNMEDDHMPFVRDGVNALDLIDFDYPPWHTDKDTMDKLSAHSFQVVGTVLVEAIRRLEQ